MLMRDVTVQHATLVLRERLNSLLAQFPPERLMRKSLSPIWASFLLGKNWFVSSHFILSFEDCGSVYLSFYTGSQSMDVNVFKRIKVLFTAHAGVHSAFCKYPYTSLVQTMLSKIIQENPGASLSCCR